MPLLQRTGLLFGLFITLACVAGAWGWYSMRYSRFPAHRVPSWQVFEDFRKARTREDIAVASEALNAFHQRYQKLPLNSPEREYQFSTTLGHELNGVSPGRGRCNTEGIVFWALPAGEQRDGWGNLYHFFMDHDADGWVHPGGIAVNRTFVIWSDGPNQRDESGNGDDLRSW